MIFNDKKIKKIFVSDDKNHHNLKMYTTLLIITIGVSISVLSSSSSFAWGLSILPIFGGNNDTSELHNENTLNTLNSGNTQNTIGGHGGNLFSVCLSMC
jgi:hypothetical protein